MINACAKPDIDMKRVKMTLSHTILWGFLIFFGQNKKFNTASIQRNATK